MAGYLGYLILNWKALEIIRQQRNYMCCIISVILSLNVLMNISQTNIDTIGHIGGLIVGLFTSLAFFQPIEY